MASYPPPTEIVSIFNEFFFEAPNASISMADVANNYLRKNTSDIATGFITFNNSLAVNGNITWNGTVLDLTGLGYVSGITPGTVSASKAVVVDSNKDISAFRNLTATSTITSLVSIATTMTCNGIDIGSNLSPLVGVTLGAPQASKALTLNASSQIAGSLTLTGTLTATSLAGTIMTAAQPNITSIGTLATLTATSITGTLQTAAQPNITSVGTLTSITTSGALTMGTTVISEAEIGVLDGVTPGTVSASKAVVVDSNKDISAFRNLTATGTITSLVSIATTMTCNGVDIGSNLSPLVGVTLGAPAASKALTLNASSQIAGSLSLTGNLTATNLTGTLQTAAQPNITSVGTLSSLTVSGGIGISNTTDATSTTNGGSITTAGGMGIAKSVWVGGTIYTNRSTSGGAFSAYCGTSNLTISALLNSDFTISTSGTTSLNIGTGSTTALTIDGFTQEIYGIGSLTATNLIGTNLTGTIQTASQPNITSLGALTSLSTGSLTLGGTLITAYASEINTLAGVVAGSAGAGKALILDMSKNIATINNLTSNYLSCNTAINGSNALGTMKALNLGGIVLDYGVMSLKGSGTKPSVSFGSTNSLLWMESSHGTPIEAEINVSSGTSSTSTNALRMGTCSSNDFNLFTNNTERVVIRAGGEVLIKRFLQVGDSTDTSRMISCLDSTMTSTNLRYITLGKTATAGNQAEIAYQWIGDNDDTNSLRFGFYGGEKMRLTRWGSLLVNSTNNSYSATPTKFASEAAGATEWCAVFKNTSNSTSKCMGFINNSSLEVGSITWGVGTTSFNTTSDYRLKKDVEPMTDGLELINRLNPVRYKWINSEESAEGFIAHELQDVLPHCVQGQRDAVYPDGSVNPQSVDYGKLTTTLVAAIQDLSAENQSLTRRLERLERLSKLKKN